jgi:hypothetical protein
MARGDRDTENTLMVIMPPALKGRLNLVAVRLKNVGDERGTMSEIVRSLLEKHLPALEREIERAEAKQAEREAKREREATLRQQAEDEEVAAAAA